MAYFDPAELLKLDAALADVEHEARNNDELVKNLTQFSLQLRGDVSEINATDPYSCLYLEKIKGVHEEIIGKQHGSNLEGLPVLNLEYEAQWPYPWGTRSPETVGRHLMSYGFLIRAADLPPHARILEVGSGLGALTWNLARMGYRVDAVDPNATQCAAASSFTRDLPMRPNVVATTLDQWLNERPMSYLYDAVVFFESFHHVMNHKQCLETLLANHMESDGLVLLGAEPIFEQVCEVLPYPWGPRLDGESLRAMRRWGWLELGFTRAYVDGLFKRMGLVSEWISSDVAFPHTQVLRGTRPTIQKLRHKVSYPGKFSDGIDFSKEGLPDFVARCTGLASTEHWGRWSEGSKVEIKYANRLPADFDLELKLVNVFGPNLHKKLKVKVGTQEYDAVLEPIAVRSTYPFKFRSVDSDLIEIVIPHPFRPKDMPELLNEDSRRIGIGLRSVVLHTTA